MNQQLTDWQAVYGTFIQTGPQHRPYIALNPKLENIPQYKDPEHKDSSERQKKTTTLFGISSRGAVQNCIRSAEVETGDG